MKTLNFSVKINAPKERVWDNLWGTDTYPQWTAVFSEGSQADSDWEEGSSVHFTDGTGNGMYGKIEKKVPNQRMTFKHLGMLKDGEEQPVDEKAKEWNGAIEDYQLNESGGVTDLKVSVDITEDHKDFFQKTFPEALQKVKELSEQS